MEIFLMVLFSGLGLFGIFNYVKSNTEFLETKVSLSKNENVKLDEEITFNFSGRVSPGSVEESLKMEPAKDFSLRWSDGNDSFALVPNGNWKRDTKYSLNINNGRNIFGIGFRGSVDFQTEGYPEVVSIVPSEGEKNVLIDIEDPISVNFDRPLDGFNVKFVIDPMGEFVSQLNEQKTSVKILSKGNLQKGKRYDVKIYVKHENSPEEDYEKTFESYFETKPEELKNWDKDITVRLSQAKNYTEPRIAEGRYIDINLKSQVMVIFENGKIVETYLISSGKAGMDSPEGSFKIENKALKPWSKKYSLFMPYWMAITPSGEYGIHELPEWPGGYKEGANHLGIPVSHGCVRLGTGSAGKIYDWAEIGTPVIIHK